MAHMRGLAKPPAASWSRVWAGGDCTCCIPELRAGRHYAFRVRAINARGAGPFAPPAACYTLAAPPSAPEGLVVANKAATSLRLRWRPPADDCGSRTHRYLVETACVYEDCYEAAYDGPDLQCTVPNLLPGTKYFLRVTAFNAAGAGPASAPETVVTPLLPPGAPAGLVLSIIAPSSTRGAGSAAAAAPGAAVHVAWDPAADSIEQAMVVGHEVEAVPRTATATSGLQYMLAVRCTVSGAGCEATLGGLVRGTTYAIRVRAVGADAAGHSAWSPTATIRLADDSRGRSVALAMPDGAAAGAAGRGRAAAAAAAAAMAMGDDDEDSDSDDDDVAGSSAATAAAGGSGRARAAGSSAAAPAAAAATSKKAKKKAAKAAAAPAAVVPLAAAKPPRKRGSWLSPRRAAQLKRAAHYAKWFVCLVVPLLLLVWMALASSPQDVAARESLRSALRAEERRAAQARLSRLRAEHSAQFAGAAGAAGGDGGGALTAAQLEQLQALLASGEVPPELAAMLAEGGGDDDL